jgi:arylsulfatase A-like enzyme
LSLRELGPVCYRRGMSFAGAATAALLIALGLAPGCDRGARSAPPSLVLVSIDTLRPDHLGAYGYPRATSPGLDALAADGVVFEHAYTPSSWTLPGHASMLTGVSPYRHGADLETRKIRDDVPLLAERLRARGYATSAIVGAPFVGARYGFARGFDRFDERIAEGKDIDAYQPAVLDAVRALPKAPFFLFVHYMSVHSPYAPPARFDRFHTPGAAASTVDASRIGQLQRALEQGTIALGPMDRAHLIDLYDGGIAAADDAVAQLRHAVRAARGDDVVFVVTSDHGEEFLEHGGLAHGGTLYDEVLRVPLIVAGPGIAAGRQVERQVSLLDVAPTLLALADGGAMAGSAGETPGSEAGAVGGPADRAASRAAMDGQPLLEALPEAAARAAVRAASGQASPTGAAPTDALRAPTLALQTNAHDGRVALRGLRSPDAKLLRDDASGRTAFFDLAADPGERTPRDPGEPGGGELLAALDLLAPARRGDAATTVAAESMQPDPRTRAALAALGYLAGDAPTATPPSSDVAP